MSDKFSLYLAALPDDTRRALATGIAPAHMAYRLSADLTLLRGHIGSDSRGGLMVLSYTPSELLDGSVAALCKELTAECRIRGYEGILLDFEGPARHTLARLASDLDTVCARDGLSLIVGEHYMEATQHAAVLLSSGLVSGSLRRKLEEYTRRCGAPRVALEIERMSQNIALPAPQGRGSAMTRTELSELLFDKRPAVFFSHELCAHYFTYKDGGITHFVLYDDSQSVIRKLRLAHMLGLKCAVMLYSEVSDMLNELREFSP
ncbi:MAG: hypothetical protein FWH06_04610 [Oscillospiraceae bacterium]|nr:hypothetical protein [Oscillospiraceae bacterium]